MKPTRQTINKYIRIQFEDVGELTNHLKEMALDTRPRQSRYDELEWDELCQKHGIDGDSRGGWA
jgi:hypothetical protein